MFTKICFGNYFYFSFIADLVDFKNIMILCNRPNYCCQQNLKSFDHPWFGVFNMFFKVQPGLGPQ